MSIWFRLCSSSWFERIASTTCGRRQTAGAKEKKRDEKKEDARTEETSSHRQVENGQKSDRQDGSPHRGTVP